MWDAASYLCCWWSEGKWLDATSWKPAAMALCRFMFLLSTVSFADEEAEKTLESHGLIWDMLCSLCLDAWTLSNIWVTNESNDECSFLGYVKKAKLGGPGRQRTEMEGHWNPMTKNVLYSAVRIKFQCRFCCQVAPACQFLQTGLHVSGAIAMHEKRNESAAIANGICLSALSDQDLLYFFDIFCICLLISAGCIVVDISEPCSDDVAVPHCDYDIVYPC